MVKVKSITLINLYDIIEAISKDVLLFSIDYDVKSVNDLTNLFISRTILKITDSYKTISNSFIFFYISKDYYDKLKEKNDFIKYKKFFNLIQKKIGFPLIISNENYLDYIDYMKQDDMICEEMMIGYRSFSEFFPNLCSIIQKYRYKKADNEIIKEVKNLVKMLSSI